MKLRTRRHITLEDLELAFEELESLQETIEAAGVDYPAVLELAHRAANNTVGAHEDLSPARLQRLHRTVAATFTAGFALALKARP